MRRFRAGELDAGTRADVFIAGKYPAFTRSSLEGLFDKEMVKLKKQPVKPSYKVRPKDTLMVDETMLVQVPPKADLPVIYEDNSVIVINKPAGVLTHSKGALNSEATVASFVQEKTHGFEPGSNRAGIVHRLDRRTSGVIIIAKDPETLKLLQKQFSQRKTKKLYTAIVEGVIEPAEAVIDAPILRNPKRPQTFMVKAAGKSAQTEYKRLKSFASGGKQYSLLEVRPRTGRTHQIRVHLAYTGHQVAGDGVYGQDGPIMYLHANSLEITLPGGQRRVFTAAPPDYFKQFEAGNA